MQLNREASQLDLTITAGPPQHVQNATEMIPEEIEKLTVAKLKDELKKRDIKFAGNARKAELVELLVEACKSEVRCACTL